ncbi:MAG: hypothetical protein C5S49_02995 [Candidatus Methanogaster sp.]|nr:MAG: hypothetical protein C5S49_02995 [ANME-2 cluster archaeon]
MKRVRESDWRRIFAVWWSRGEHPEAEPISYHARACQKISLLKCRLVPIARLLLSPYTILRKC